jgi:hypothetical protein
MHIYMYVRRSGKSLLSQHLLCQDVPPLPSGYLVDLVVHCHVEEEEDYHPLKEVFLPVLCDLRAAMQSRNADSGDFGSPIQALSELLEIKVVPSDDRSTSAWPLCQLVSTVMSVPCTQCAPSLWVLDSGKGVLSIQSRPRL